LNRPLACVDGRIGAVAGFFEAIPGARRLAGRHTPCGLSIREDENPVTGNPSRFLPHAIL
jgi:hypothetical protein